MSSCPSFVRFKAPTILSYFRLILSLLYTFVLNCLCPISFSRNDLHVPRVGSPVHLRCPRPKRLTARSSGQVKSQNFIILKLLLCLICPTIFITKEMQMKTFQYYFTLRDWQRLLIPSASGVVRKQAQQNAAGIGGGVCKLKQTC